MDDLNVCKHVRSFTEKLKSLEKLSVNLSWSQYYEDVEFVDVEVTFPPSLKTNIIYICLYGYEDRKVFMLILSF